MNVKRLMKGEIRTNREKALSSGYIKASIRHKRRSVFIFSLSAYKRKEIIVAHFIII